MDGRQKTEGIRGVRKGEGDQKGHDHEPCTDEGRQARERERDGLKTSCGSLSSECEGGKGPDQGAQGSCQDKDIVTVYPPGVPLLVPGEEITAPVIDTLCRFRDSGATMDGLDMTNRFIGVVGESPSPE